MKDPTSRDQTSDDQTSDDQSSEDAFTVPTAPPSRRGKTSVGRGRNVVTATANYADENARRANLRAAVDRNEVALSSARRSPNGTHPTPDAIRKLQCRLLAAQDALAEFRVEHPSR